MKTLLELIKKVWKKGLVHVLAGNFMTKLVSFFGSIFLVRVLSKQEYGILGYLENLYGYVLVLAGMGLSNAILRYVVRADDTSEKYAFFRYAYRKGFLWNLLLIALAGVFIIFYPHKEDYKNYTWLINILLLGLPFQYLTDNVLCNERAMFANQRYAVMSFLLSFAIIISKIAFGYFGGIKAVVFSQVLVYALLAILMMLSTKKHYYSNISAVGLSAQTKRQVDGYSLQYMITNGLWTIFMLNDTFILGRFCNPSVIAEYRAAYTLPGSVALISSALGIFVAPYFVRNENNPAWVKRNFIRVYSATAVVVGIVCLGIGVLARPVVWLLYGEEYLNIVGIMRILLLAAFLNCGLRFTTANLLAAMGEVKYNMIVSGIGMAMQIAINLYAAPIYGVISVTITSCVVYAFMAVALLVVFVKKHITN